MQPANKAVSQIQRKDKIRICFVGATGNGKSSTANFLMGRKMFEVSNNLESCTSEVKIEENEEIILIDTIGFGDNKVTDKEITRTLMDLSNRLLEYTFNLKTETMVDCFLLVQKATPRMSTLIKDLENMRKIFGYKSLKSLIILVIQPKYEGMKEKKTYAEIEKSFEEMDVVKNLYANIKQKVNFILWDNYKPYENQLVELIKRVQKLPKFTHKIFKEAAEEREMEQMKMVEELFGEEMEKQKEILEMAKEESQEIMNQLKQQVLDKEKLAIQIEEEKQRAIKRNEEITKQMEELKEKKSSEENLIKMQLKQQELMFEKMRADQEERSERELMYRQNQEAMENRRREDDNRRREDEQRRQEHQNIRMQQWMQHTALQSELNRGICRIF